MSKQDADRVRGALAKLIENPHRKDIDAAKLRGQRGFRLRVGDWHVIFDRNDQSQEVDALRIGLRRDIYRR